MVGEVRRLLLASVLLVPSAHAYAQEVEGPLPLVPDKLYQNEQRRHHAPVPQDQRAHLPQDQRAHLPQDQRAHLPQDQRAHLPLDLLAVDAEKNSPSSGESKTSAQPADRSGNAERRSETAAGGDNRGPDHGIYTWSIFGFTEGSDTDTPGGKTLYGQSDALLSKAIPGYWALEGNIGVSYSTDERMNVFAGASAGDEVILDNLRGSIVDSGSSTNAGVSGGIKYQFFDRANYGFGFAAQAAPYLTRTSPVLSPTIQAFGSEFRLLADTEFVPQVLFGAVNFAYTPEASSGSSGTTSSVEVSTALTGRVFDKFFLGAEARYLEKYQGLLFDQRLGWAMFAGPTLYISVADKGYFGIAWSVQMFGRPADQPSARLDLKNYERNQVRVKAGFYF